MSRISGFKNIAAVVLAGGLGTRLKTIVDKVPKVMAPVMGKPFLRILLEQIAKAEFNDVYICTGYMKEKVKEEFGTFYRKLNIIYSEEIEPLGTGGAIVNVLNILPPETEMLLVLNGDSYLHIDLIDYIHWFIEKNIDCAIAIKSVADSERYGSVEIDSRNKVLGFYEKKHNSGSGKINAGIYLFKKNVFDSFKKDSNISMEKDILPELIKKKMLGYECNGDFIDIGTPESYSHANKFFKNII